MDRSHHSHRGSDHDSCDGCSGQMSNPSVHQTLDELDFSRGIWTAAVGGTLDEVREFLDVKHVDPNITDGSGYTALHYACRRGNAEICRLLLSSGASPNIQTKSGGVTPLHRAAYCGHSGIVEMLLQARADPLLPDLDGKLPLHKAAESGDEKTIRVLMECSGGSELIQDSRSRRPLDCVKPAQMTDTIQKLLQYPT